MYKNILRSIKKKMIIFKKSGKGHDFPLLSGIEVEATFIVKNKVAIDKLLENS